MGGVIIASIALHSCTNSLIMKINGCQLMAMQIPSELIIKIIDNIMKVTVSVYHNQINPGLHIIGYLLSTIKSSSFKQKLSQCLIEYLLVGCNTHLVLLVVTHMVVVTVVGCTGSFHGGGHSGGWLFEICNCHF